MNTSEYIVVISVFLMNYQFNNRALVLQNELPEVGK